MAIYSMQYINESESIINESDSYLKLASDNVLFSISECENYFIINESDNEDKPLDKEKIKEFADRIFEAIKRFFKEILSKIAKLKILVGIKKQQKDIKDEINVQKSVKEMYEYGPSINYFHLSLSKLSSLIEHQLDRITYDSTVNDVKNLVIECKPYFSVDENTDRNDTNHLTIPEFSKNIVDLEVVKGCDLNKLLKLSVQNEDELIKNSRKNIDYIEKSVRARIKENLYGNKTKGSSDRFKKTNLQFNFVSEFITKVYLHSLNQIASTNKSNIDKAINILKMKKN